MCSRVENHWAVLGVGSVMKFVMDDVLYEHTAQVICSRDWTSTLL